MAEERTTGNAICSICYEDLKPVVENLQSISACGHVFHELCLQQWFEYCPSTNKRNCPICKRKCSLKDPCRLYFQSSGNQIDSIVSKKIGEIDDDPVLLRGEVKRLQGKILNLSSALEAKEKENVEVSDKLHQCNEKLKEDKVKRWEALQEISTTQHLLKLKSQECIELTVKCAKQQETSLALAKELAALKLVSDLSLEEDDVLKLALLGNNANTKDTIDTLVKSLVIRNRSYKELLAKCNQLGRGEARSSEKLEKALEKIDKLKKRMREVEMISEERENKALRNIKASMNCSDREPLSTPLSKLENNDSFTRKTDSVIDVDIVTETKAEEKCDNHMIKDIKFNLTTSQSPHSNGGVGTFRSLGRWNKHGEKKEPTAPLGCSVPSNDDLISFGPDGKGGRIKVLRSKPQISNTNASLGSGKRFKLGTGTGTGTRTGGSSSQGCLQIEHYFGKHSG